MIRYLIILSSVAFSIQINNCDYEQPVCKSCIAGYKLYYGQCIKGTEEAISNPIQHCLIHQTISGRENPICFQCENGYRTVQDGATCEDSKHCKNWSNNECIECEEYFELKEGNCVKSTCQTFQDDKCICEKYYYLNSNNGCSRIPIEGCQKGNATYCTKCEGENEYYKRENGLCKLIPSDNDDGDDDDDKDDDRTSIANCWYADPNDNTKCANCYEFYEWDDNEKKCKNTCADIQKICGSCEDNYHSYDYGKTCEIIDPNYKPGSKSKSIFISLYWASLVLLLSLIL